MTALAPLALLVLLLPFEPMTPAARLLGFQLSHLELAAFLLLGTSAAALVSRVPRLGLPLAAPALCFLGAYLLSAAFSEGSSVLPLKFTLRMTAGVVALLLTAQALSAAGRFQLLFLAFASAGALTAGAALLEWGSSFDSLLSPFREHSFEVGGRSRVAATFAYPNTAGGFLVLALPFAIYFFLRDRARWLFFLLAVAMFTAILLTYSRGALLGAAAASLSFWLLAHRSRLERREGLAGLQASFVLVTGYFLVVEPSYRWRASSEGDRSWYLARITPEREELSLAAGELTGTKVRVANVGKLTWASSGEKPFHLSYRWFRPRGEDVEPLAVEGERTALSSPLAPGGEVELLATLRAPAEPGSYLLVWDMVHEHTTWFSDKVGWGTPVSVVVGKASRREEAPPREIRDAIAEKSWRPGRKELWSIAGRLFLANPLLGVGPDNFRWLYGPASGHEAWDTRVFSNSLYLELLATVGLAGFAAFSYLVAKALLGLTGRLASGTRPLEAAALGSSLSGFLVHGLFDYLLAFTPIYLALFVLLGAASAAIHQEPSS